MKTGFLLQPLPPNSGILFGNVSSDDVVPVHVDYVQTTEFATSLKKGMAVAKTIEHLMAVFHAYRITNLMVKMIEEIPIMDGSALEFCKLIEEAGVEEQEERVEELIIDRRFEISNGKQVIGHRAGGGLFRSLFSGLSLSHWATDVRFRPGK